jgi:hypothetical protein
MGFLSATLCLYAEINDGIQWNLVLNVYTKSCHANLILVPYQPDGTPTQFKAQSRNSFSHKRITVQKLVKDKGKGKVVPVLFLTEHQSMEAYWRSGCIAPRILDLGARWRWVISFTARPPGTHWIGGWVGLRAGLDAEVKRKFPSPCWYTNPRSSSPELYHWDIPAPVQKLVHDLKWTSDIHIFYFNYFLS